jgi:DNA-binding CsgD family transcriptional regulator
MESLRLVGPGESVNSARRLEVEAHVAYHRLEFQTALRLFDDALKILDRVPHDRYLELNIIGAAASQVVEALDIDRWLSLSHRAGRLEPVPVCLWWQYFALHQCRSLAAEIVGHPNAALEEADYNIADELPITIRIFGMCRKAAVLFRYGEVLAYRDLVRSILKLYRSAQLPKQMHPQETGLHPVLAETFSRAGAVDAAEGVIEDARTRSAPDTPWRYSPLLEAQYDYAFGLIADARGQTFQARHHYQSALRTFQRFGYHRRGVIVAQYLAEMDPNPDLIRYIDGHARRLGPRSWLRQRFAKTIQEREQPALAELSRAEREVLDLLMAGNTTKQIAQSRGRSQNTVRNTISSLLKIFGVDNRQALVCECIRRGIPSPVDGS